VDVILRRFLLLLLLVLAAGGCGSAPPAAPTPRPAPATLQGSGGVNRPEHRDKPYVVLISFDGFRPDYLDRFELPSFRRVLKRGARARAMIPVFPSLTFPNHYSLVTGLYADRHGIVGNSFYDPDRKETYSLSDRKAVTDGTWYRGEPIWVTAETQGMVTAAFFWPGSEASIKGVVPTYRKEYNQSTSNEERVNGVLEWLRLPEERRPHLLTLYFSELDSASHRGAMNSPQIELAAKSLDRSLGTLMDRIDAMPIHDRVYLVLTSDHGMVETGRDQTYWLDTMIDPGLLQVAFGGPVANLYVKDRSPKGAQEVRDALSVRLRHGRAYLRRDLPPEFHYSSDPRVGDVVVVMDESWTLATSPSTPKLFTRWGMHGWDPKLPSMHALFVIAGPGTRPGAVIPEVLNVDVYPLLTELLGLRAARDIDGRAGHIWKLVMQ
jgi:predicted AlkP superfamily pyrophosphatase or phosphodiesterase